MAQLHFGLIGGHLGHSLSPLLHDCLFSSQKTDADYRLYEKTEEEIPRLKDWINSRHLSGLNVTIPYKQTVLPLCDRLHDSAEQIGAVNTIAVTKDGLTGYNTDYLGVLYMFEKGNIALSEREVTILGSGGASKAFIYAAHTAGASRITAAGRNARALSDLKRQFPFIHTVSYTYDNGVLSCPLHSLQGDVLINTTPVGMFPKTDHSPVPSAVIRQFKAAADAVYNPLETLFLKTAKSEGLSVVSGLHMLIGQAVAAQELWLGRHFDRSLTDRLYDLLTEELSKKE